MSDDAESVSIEVLEEPDEFDDPVQLTRRARLETNVVIRNTFIEIDDEEHGELVKITRRERRSKTMPSSTSSVRFDTDTNDGPTARPLSPSRPASIFSSVVMQIPDIPPATPQASRRNSRRPSVEGGVSSIPDLQPVHVVPTSLDSETPQPLDPLSSNSSPVKLIMASDIAPRTISWQEHTLSSASCAPSSGESSRVLGYVWLLSQDAQGCRLVQDELLKGSEQIRLAIVAELRGHICEALRSPHANFVVRKCVEVIPPLDLQFVIDELLSVGSFAVCEVARNRFGCRIIESLFTHCPSSQLHDLAEVLIEDSSDLCGHMYGNFAIQTLIEYGTEEHKKHIFQALETKVADFGQRFYALAVYRAAFKSAADEERSRIARAIVDTPDVLVSMSRYKNGPDFIEEVLAHLDVPTCNVVRAQLAAAASLRQERAAKVAAAAPKPKASRFKSGKQQQRNPSFQSRHSESATR